MTIISRVCELWRGAVMKKNNKYYLNHKVNSKTLTLTMEQKLKTKMETREEKKGDIPGKSLLQKKKKELLI